MLKELSFILMLVVTSNGFLLDDKIPQHTTTKPTFSEEHFAIILNLFAEEKQSRIKLEKRVMQLESELLSTQKGVTDIYHTGLQHNETIKQQTANMESLSNTVSNLQQQYNLLLTSIGQIQMNQTLLNNLAAQITHKLHSFEQSKSALDMKMVLDIRNETTTLATELQNTNNQLNLVQSDVNARKQDFMALFKKADLTASTLEHSLLKIETNFSNLRNQSKEDLHNATTYVLGLLQNERNETTAKLNAAIQKENNRAALTSCASEKSYSGNQIIPYKEVHTFKGISNTGIDGIKRTGTFTCESPGLYLISVFVMTRTDGAVAILYKNNQVKAYDYFSLKGNYQTNTVLVLDNLKVNDTISVKANSQMYVHGGRQSCLTVLQIH